MLAHIPFENLEIVFRWNIPGTTLSAKLPEEYFKYHQIEPKQFLDEIINASSFKEQIKVFPLSKIFHTGDTEIPHEQEMYCITNQKEDWGAASILNKDIMDEIADFFGGKTYIIPANIHECMAIDLSLIHICSGKFKRDSSIYRTDFRRQPGTPGMACV